jgi:hypothetical protein
MKDGLLLVPLCGFAWRPAGPRAMNSFRLSSLTPPIEHSRALPVDALVRARQVLKRGHLWGARRLGLGCGVNRLLVNLFDRQLPSNASTTRQASTGMRCSKESWAGRDGQGQQGGGQVMAELCAAKQQGAHLLATLAKA